MKKLQTRKLTYRPKRSANVVGYCRATADALVVLSPARSLPIGYDVLITLRVAQAGRP